MPVLIEINSGEEAQKSGVNPDEAVDLIRAMSSLKEHPKVRGIWGMTMGPFAGILKHSRPYFQKTRKIFDALKAMDLPGVEMKYLSMACPIPTRWLLRRSQYGSNRNKAVWEKRVTSNK